MKVALVTGASRGLGKEIVLAFAKKGYAVVVNYLASERSAGEVVKEAGGGSFSLQADVHNREHVRAMLGLIEERCGRLDIVVNNAGITKDNLLLMQAEKEWDEVIETNLTGCFNVIRASSPLMIKSGGGHFVNVSSRSGLIGKAGQAAYSAAKAGLFGITRTLAAELAAHNIRVNAVLPGYMPTGMGTAAERAMGAAREASLLKRLSDPYEVAAFIAFLVTTENITGQVFSLDNRL